MMIVSVIVARDEEATLTETVDSIRSQVDQIIVVDDGSTEPIQLKGCMVIRLPSHKESLVGCPELALRWCIGLQEARKYKPDYIFIVGADHVIEAGYVKEIAERMSRDGTVIGAGALNETPRFFKRNLKIASKVPPGSGRVIDAYWWEKTNGCKYPYGWGWESWLLHEALRQGHRITIYGDMPMRGNRPAKWSFRKGFRWGRGCYALGLLPVGVLARFRTYWWAPTFMMGLLGGYVMHPHTGRYPLLPEYKKAYDIDRYRRRLRHIFHRVH